MRTSLLNLDAPVERPARPVRPSPQPQAQATLREAPAPPAAAPPPQPPTTTGQADESDFEVVFGRRQLAGTGLVLLVVLAVFSGICYLIGKTEGSKAAGAAPQLSSSPQTSAVAPTAPAKPQVPPAAAAAAPAPVQVSAQPPVNLAQDRPPVFADAATGQVYIQVGAVEKGLAGVWAEGLRAHGLEAFASTGPSERIWRVLVGPLPDPQSYQHAKDVLDALGIATFGKRHIDDPAAKPAGSQPSRPSAQP